MLWLGHFLWPFLRITGLFLTAPLYGSSLIPGMVKAMLAAGAGRLAGLLAAGPAALPGDPFSAIFTGFMQITYGAVLGMAMQIVVAAIACAGEIVGLAMGLSFAELQFRESPGATPVLSDLMLWAGLMGFMAAGGPVWLFAALAHSFAQGSGSRPSRPGPSWPRWAPPCSAPPWGWRCRCWRSRSASISRSASPPFSRPA